MKKLLITITSILCASVSIAQLLNENFESGIPADWTGWSDDGILWTADAGTGMEESTSALADYGISSEMGYAQLETPILNFTGYTELELTFNASLVQNNFLPPELSLLYDIGDGWVVLESWGMEDFPAGSDYEPPVDFENTSWSDDLVIDLTDFEGLSTVKFAFKAYFPNGGYTLIDNVMITSAEDEPSGVEAFEFGQVAPRLSMFPNPSSGKVVLDFNEIQIDQIVIFNACGQEVTEFVEINKKSSVMMDFTNLEKGIYFVSIYDKSDGIFIRRLMIE